MTTATAPVTLRRAAMRVPRRSMSTATAAASIVGCLLVAAILGFVAPEAPEVAVASGLVLLVGLTIFVNPDVATLLVMGTIYSNAALVAVKVQGAPNFISSAVPMLLIVPFAYTVAIRRQRLIAPPALGWVVGYVLVLILGTIFATDQNIANSELTTFLTEGLGLYLVITNVVRTPQVLRRVVWILLIVGAVLGALSTIQYVTSNYENDFLGFAQVSEAEFRVGNENSVLVGTQRRLGGPLGQQNRYAQIMLVLVPLGIFRYRAERQRGLKLLAVGCTVLCTLGMALTFSRGAFVGLALTMIAMAIMRYVRLRQLIAAFVAVVLLLWAVPAYRERLSTLQELGARGSQNSADGAVRSRITEMGAALLVFGDHPIVGVGPGLFPSYYQEYAGRIGLRVQSEDRQSHSLFAGLLAENGILGFIGFFGAAAAILRRLNRSRKRWLQDRPDLADLSAGFFLALVAYLASGIFLHMAFHRYYWLLLALGAACVHAAEEAATPVTAREPRVRPRAPAPRSAHHVHAR